LGVTAGCNGASLMLLYTEKQLNTAYNIYRMHQIGQGLAFMELENFRRLYEEIMEKIV
jgi:hypothetical protein